MSPVRGGETLEAVALEPGTVVGERYRVGERLGAGARGAVFEAIDQRTGQALALKVLHPAYGAAERYRAVFEERAGSASRLRHLNLVPVLDLGVEEMPGGVYRLWLASELVVGSSLASLAGALRQNARAELRLAVEAIAGVLGALWFAHQHGVCHGGLRPENVLECVESDGTNSIKVLDLGIAPDAETERSLVLSGDVVGDPGFMAPEQLTGRGVRPSADLYAVGCIAFALFTGQPPFPRPSRYQVIGSQIQDPPPLPSALDPHLPAAVDMFLLRALEKDPAARFLSADEMLDALRRLAGELEVKFRDPRKRSGQVLPPRPAVRTRGRPVSTVAPGPAVAALEEPPGAAPALPEPGASGRRGLVLGAFALAAVVAAYLVLTAP